MSDFQMALLFPYIPFLVVFGFLWALGILSESDDDNDDGPDDGIMIPAYALPTNSA